MAATVAKPELAETPVVPPSMPPSEKSGEKAEVSAEQTPDTQQQNLDVVEKIPESLSKEKSLKENASKDSIDRDAQLAQVETEKTISLINAWEENEKCKAENKAHKKIANVESWENRKIASLETERRKIEEKLEKKKAEYVEEMNRKMGIVHKEAKEKIALIEAKRGEYVLKVEEVATKYRAIGKPPKKILGLF